MKHSFETRESDAPWYASPKNTAALLEFTLAGDITTFAGSSHHTLSGYDRPDNFQMSDSAEYPDGCPVLDKRTVLEARPGLCVRSPMVDPTLKNGQVDRCPVPSACMTAGLQGDFQRLATLKTTCPEFSGLDSVSVPDFVAWWIDKGARYGEFKSGQIVWDGVK